MGEVIVSFIKAFAPGSLWQLLLISTIVLILLYIPHRRSQWCARLLLTCTVLVFWLLTFPAVSDAVMRGYPPIQPPSVGQNRESDHVGLVVLGAGILTYRSRGDEVDVLAPQSAFNVMRGSELYKEMNHPWVIVSGGIADVDAQRSDEAHLLAAELRAHGVPDARMILENTSSNTRTQAVNVAKIANARGLDELVIITSPAHLRRAVPVFRAQAIQATGYPADFISERNTPLAWWRPTGFSSDLARDALYDYFGWVYYWGRGWLVVPNTK